MWGLALNISTIKTTNSIHRTVHSQINLITITRTIMMIIILKASHLGRPATTNRTCWPKRRWGTSRSMSMYWKSLGLNNYTTNGYSKIRLSSSRTSGRNLSMSASEPPRRQLASWRRATPSQNWSTRRLRLCSLTRSNLTRKSRLSKNKVLKLKSSNIESEGWRYMTPALMKKTKRTPKHMMNVQCVKQQSKMNRKRVPQEGGRDVRMTIRIKRGGVSFWMRQCSRHL